ncbi:MAG TPA: SDR family NAD(P)-dependent oxidoreductase, partial [Ktedonobacteraceae bacterium]|nr:SDR family NAD(P)-dependent oxidoreductase [Ktedonobacteraceae bacterium]
MTHAMSGDTNYDTAIALIGISGRFPGARNVEAFWRNVTAGAKSIRFFSDEELLAAGANAELLAQPNYVKAGAVLDDADMFDASFFKFSPREAEVTDPQHRVFLECAWEALEDAGYNPETYQDLIGVFAGSAFGTYMLNNLAPNREILNLIGPIQASIGNDKDSLASMVSYKLNLRGPSIAVQTFCSTSLVATHLACQSLLNFECDIALAGGVAIFIPQVAGYLFEEGGILSPDGECRAFDANGRGSVMGNGVAIIALKRLADAIEDGDQIYSVLLGSAVNNDGSVRVSYTAPGLGGQTEVIAQALSNANVSAETIGYVEAHGTATVLGDAVELAAMKKAFRRDTEEKQFCAIGSLKPNVGHLDRASGVSGLIKAALALKHQVLPPSLNFERANDDVDLENSPFYVSSQLQEWHARNWPRRAGVSSFGVGGTNAHIVLEEPPELEPSSPARPWQLLLLSAKTEYSLHAATTNLATFLQHRPELNLADAAYTLQVGRGSFNHRRFVVARDSADAVARLQAQAPTANQTHRDRPVAFLLPDLDQQSWTMALELSQQEATFRETVERCLTILRERANLDLHELLLAGKVPAPPDELTQQVVLFVVEYALAQLFAQHGIQPQALLGQGIGEYVAACLSGVLSPDDALELVVRRARLLQSASSQQTAQHSGLTQGLTFHAPQIPFISSVSGTWITAEEATDPAYWERQLAHSAQGFAGIAQLLQETECVLLEVGPGRTLSSLAKQHPACDPERLTQIIETLATSQEFQSERAALLNALGRLWLAGVAVDWASLYQGERRLRVSLPTYAFEHRRYWLESPEVLQYRERVSASALISRKPDKADWFYRARWEQEALTVMPTSGARNWLVFMDEVGLAEQVAARLEGQQRFVRVSAGAAFARQDEQTFTIRPGEAADYVRLCEALVATGRLPERVLHCWCVSAENETMPADSQTFRAEQERGFYSLLFLAQALAPHIYDKAVQVLAISTHAQAVTGKEVLQPEKATLLGACKVIPQEPLNISCRSIDLAASSDVNWLQSAAAQVAAECQVPANDLVVAYRDNRRWVQRYEAVRLPEKQAETPLFRQHGVYLITGGLGGIGLALAEHLARTVQARVVLVGRSGLPERQQWQAWLESHPEQDSTGERIRRVQAIEAAGGQVLVCQADVADENQMRGIVQVTLATFGALHGVFHAAGITNESSFKAVQDLSRDLCETHFQGKVYGTYALQEAVSGIELDFCLLFSSLSATLGGLGFTAYTAANIFLDAFASRYNQHAQRPWVSVNWDTWQVREDVHGAFGATVAAFAMSPAEGIEALTRILASGHTHIINSTGDLTARIRQWIRLESLQEIDDAPTSGEPGAQLVIAEDYEPKIAEIWCQVLGVEQVSPHDNFFDLGGNSLVALEVISRLKKAFRMQIPAVALFEAPTVSTLAKYLCPSAPDAQVAAKHNILEERRQRAKQHTQQDGIAIVGMALRFPGAATVEQFWENLRDGKESITFFSDEELLAAGVDPQTLRDPDYVKARPVLDGIDQFDANFFGYSPREAELTDPQHRIFLECAWEAMESAGYDTRSYDGLIGVFGGTNLSTYLLTLIAGSPEALQSIDGFQIGIGNDKDSLTTSVSYKLNLRGPSFAVQTFCSTSLVATHLACQSLLHGECDMAMAGGVSIRVPDRVGYWFQEGGQESSDGHCRTFDAKSQGSVLGDGVGVVVLKRLSDALEDGDIIHAVIQGSAINNDGSLKISYSAPSVAGQSEVVVQALASAGVLAEDIGYVEAHGTATELGDPIEVASLTKAYRTQTDNTGYCAIGSLKTNMGHLDRAAGVAGLIKTVLALKHEQIPASLHFESPNPEIDFEHSPFFVNTQLRSWQRSEKPRYAGVNSLGMGGTNVHVVLKEAPASQVSSPSRPWQLLTLSAKTETALEKITANLHDYLRVSHEVELADVAYTLQVGRTTLEQRRVLVCRDRADALAALEQPSSGRLLTMNQDQRERAVAFLLPGVGEQRPGMTRDLYENEATFKAAVDRCCSYIKEHFALDLYEVLYPSNQHETIHNTADQHLSAPFGRNGHTPDRIGETVLAQPAVFVIEYAMAQLLMQWGIRPRALLGYSMGEYVAACLAGVLSLEDALTLVTRRAQLIQELPAGAMLAVALSEEALQPYLNEQVNLAIINAPNTCVLAGPVEAIEQVEARLRQHEIAHRRVETSHAFHSNMLESLQAGLTELVRGLKLNPPTIPYLSNVTGNWISEEEATDPGYWARHMCETVRFADGVTHLLEETTYALLEVGPGQALGSFVRQHPACKRERFSQIISTSPASHERLADNQALLTAVGRLWLAGVTPDWEGLYAGERRQRVLLPTYPFERKRYWLEPTRPSRRASASAAPAPLARVADPAHWFYREGWSPTPLPSAPAPALRYRWLVLSEETGLSEQVVRRLRQQGYPVTQMRRGTSYARLEAEQFQVRAEEAADYAQVLQTLAQEGQLPRRVLHSWAVSAPASVPSVARLQEQEVHGFLSLVYLARALAEHALSDPLALLVLTTGAQQVGVEDRVQPDQRLAQGASLVITQEPLNVACRCLDLEADGVTTGWQDASLLDALVAECMSVATENSVAYRQGVRYARRYEPCVLPAVADGSAVVRPGGVYLLTGGLGGIGLALAEALARDAQAKLVLLSRRAWPAREGWERWLEEHEEQEESSQVVRRLQGIEALGGQVLVVQAEVSEQEQMRAAVAQAQAHFGGLDGVFHLAGVVEEQWFQAVQEVTPEVARVHLHAKGYGTVALAEALEQERDLDFVVVFSSLAATLGGLGFVAYAGANQYEEGYVDWANRAGRGRWISVGWDTWLVRANAHGSLGGTIASFAMEPEEGIEALYRVLG